MNYRHPERVTSQVPATPIVTPEENARIYLLPGEMHIATAPCQMLTILGSCVAICLWDCELRIGGMNHYLLPVSRESEGASMRFGNLAIPALLQKLAGLGCNRHHLAAKIFGGAALFQNQDSYLSSLGAKNVEIAVNLMQGASIPVMAQNTGGKFGRKIIFNTEDGSVLAKRL